MVLHIQHWKVLTLSTVGKLLCRFLFEFCRRCAKINSKLVWSSLATPSQHHHSSSTHGISGISTIFPPVCSCRFLAVFAITCGTGDSPLCHHRDEHVWHLNDLLNQPRPRFYFILCSLTLSEVSAARKYEHHPRGPKKNSHRAREKLSNERTLFFQLRRRARAMKCKWRTVCNKKKKKIALGGNS